MERMSQLAINRLHKQVFEYEMDLHRTTFHNTKHGLIKCCGSNPDKAKRTSCGKIIEIHKAYKCLYCEFYFCKDCAEKHFGKTREQYFEKNNKKEELNKRN